jgi:hypothetical protein
MRRVRDGLSTSATIGAIFRDNFKISSEQIDRFAATLILTPFASAACARQRVRVVKCVGEDNVIDPLQRRLKQKRSEVHKRAIFFMNRQKENDQANSLPRTYFQRSRSLALGASV